MVKNIFIVGCGRSGTTLLKSILSAHPDIYVSPETFFYTSIVPKAPKRTDLLDFVVSRWWIADAGITRDRMLKHLPDKYGADDVFRALMAVFGDDHRNCVIGEKTPNHVNHLREIRVAFPEGKFIQMMRDPRAVLASYKKAKVGTNQVYGIINEWAKAANVYLENCNNNDFFCIRYEDLVTDPQSVLKKLFDFVGVDWDEGVLNFHNRAERGYSVEQAHHINTMRPIFHSSLESWRKGISLGELAVLESKLGDLMEKVGYEPTNAKAPFLESRYLYSRLAYFVHKLAILYPRQKLKAYRAKRRIKLAEKLSSCTQA